MYEQAEPVRTPQAGSGGERNPYSKDVRASRACQDAASGVRQGTECQAAGTLPRSPDRRGNTSGHVGRGKQACHKYQEEEDTSSNVYEKAETVKLENIPRDAPYGTDTSTDADPSPPDGARVKGRRVCCIAAALAVVATLATVGIILLIFINETNNYKKQEDISNIPTTVDALKPGYGQNQTGAIGAVQCPLMSPPLNGFMTGPNSYGDVVNFTCEPGYNLVGTSSLTCLPDGTWNGNLPTCTDRNVVNTAAQCPLLSPPLNGFMTGSNSYGDVVNFTCDPGYNLVGTSSLSCLSDGTWNGNLPSCTAVQCPLPSPPLNGFMTGSNSYGDVVNFKCNPGYNLVGTSSLSCLSDGTWNGNLPSCADHVHPTWLGIMPCPSFQDL
ncbi:PREDICTED: E-selectin-like [Branchiostoma belcheri]|uniref:E-selectin-like n=1 Tax=Branchiostoma belcheri TaxID=7741 RepID=A0A6P4ZH35_BRABE|nr:PREDICTED: E-selectin-like [Branchiostoma belcheri]